MNFQTILSLIPGGEDYRVTGSGKIIEKDPDLGYEDIDSDLGERTLARPTQTNVSMPRGQLRQGWGRGTHMSRGRSRGRGRGLYSRVHRMQYKKSFPTTSNFYDPLNIEGDSAPSSRNSSPSGVRRRRSPAQTPDSAKKDSKMQKTDVKDTKTDNNTSDTITVT